MNADLWGAAVLFVTSLFVAVLAIQAQPATAQPSTTEPGADAVDGPDAPGSRWRSRVQGRGVFEGLAPAPGADNVIYMTPEEPDDTPAAASPTSSGCQRFEEVAHDPATGTTEWRAGVTCIRDSGDVTSHEGPE